MAVKLDRTNSGYTIDAADLSSLLGREPSDVQRMMRDGTITSRLERGEGEDEGRCRVTFLDGACRVRLVLDRDGRVLKRTRISTAPLPAAPR